MGGRPRWAGRFFLGTGLTLRQPGVVPLTPVNCSRFFLGTGLTLLTQKRISGRGLSSRVVTPSSYVPRRGDVVWLTFNPQAGRRPAVVLSPLSYNAKVGLALLCPITSAVKGYPFEVTIPNGLPVNGVILADQVKSLDWQARDVEFICALPAAVTRETLQKFGLLVAE